MDRINNDRQRNDSINLYYRVFDGLDRDEYREILLNQIRRVWLVDNDHDRISGGYLQENHSIEKKDHNHVQNHCK